MSYQEIATLFGIRYHYVVATVSYLADDKLGPIVKRNGLLSAIPNRKHVLFRGLSRLVNAMIATQHREIYGLVKMVGRASKPNTLYGVS